MISTFSVAVIGVLLVLFVALILLWAITEELPKVERVPYFERLEPGEWGVRIERVGRRKSKAFRLANEVLGGDVAVAKGITDHPPAVLIEGISEPLAKELASAFEEVGAEATAFQSATS